MLQRAKIGEKGFEFEDKVEQALTVLKMHQVKEGYYLAFSGGKDSVVIYELAKMAGVEFDAHYNFTTVDPPELINFIRDKHSDVEMHYPEETMWELIPRKLMPPTRMVRYCCDVLKEQGGNDREIVITGVRREESNNRASRCVFEQDSRKKDKFYLNPIITWTDEDVWDFIEDYDLDYCKLYDEGFDRLGCIMCPMANKTQMKFEADKYPKYYQNYIRAFDRMLEERERRGKETDWKTGEEVMKWWVNGGCKEKTAKGQCELKMMSDN
jgi:phosphoadenosine phosphosulfate reductase